MLTEFKGRTAVVTGAASGIGRSLVRHALGQGMNVVAADRDATTLKSVLKEEEAGSRLVSMVVDVRSDDQVAALADFAYTCFGAVHLLCNNAGISCSGAAWEFDPAAWQRILDVNFFGAVRGVFHFLPRMIAAGTSGAIVNTASLSAICAPVPSMAPYSAGKHALLGMSESLLRDLRSRDVPITVSLLCPGPVKTGLMTDLSPEDRTIYHDETMRTWLEQVIDGGIACDTVAAATFEAIAVGRFWVFTHPELLAAARQRFDEMVGSGFID